MKRFQTYFGVPIPPFKTDKLGAGSVTIRFIITGKIPSKKNNQMSVAVRKFARKWLRDQAHVGRPEAEKAVSMCKSKVRPNEQYQKWVEHLKPVMQSQSSWWADRIGVVFPLKRATLSLRLYFKDRYITDTVNKQQSIQDLLVEAKIIANDDYKTLNPIHSASASFFGEIVEDIAFISLSFRL